MAARESAAGGGQNFGPLAAIRLQFPNWRLWRSDVGRCWATRVGRPPESPPYGFAMTVDGDTPAQLREAIEAQEERAGSG